MSIDLLITTVYVLAVTTALVGIVLFFIEKVMK